VALTSRAWQNEIIICDIVKDDNQARNRAIAPANLQKYILA